jgi:TATA-binding protein-associated factor
MPSWRPADALARLYALQKAPWNWPQWQKLTGIQDGLFPEDPSKRPKGLSKQDSLHIETFLVALSLLPNEDTQLKFAARETADQYDPGRQAWRKFIGSQWQKWNVSGIINDLLREKSCHPIDIMLADDTTDFPESSTLAPRVQEDVALTLFGPEVISENGLVHTKYRKVVGILVQKVWTRINQSYRRMTKRFPAYEQAALDAFNGE